MLLTLVALSHLAFAAAGKAEFSTSNLRSGAGLDNIKASWDKVTRAFPPLPAHLANARTPFPARMADARGGRPLDEAVGNVRFQGEAEVSVQRGPQRGLRATASSVCRHGQRWIPPCAFVQEQHAGPVRARAGCRWLSIPATRAQDLTLYVAAKGATLKAAVDAKGAKLTEVASASKVGRALAATPQPAALPPCPASPRGHIASCAAQRALDQAVVQAAQQGRRA